MSAAQLTEDLIDADAGPHRDRSWRPPLRCAARRNHRSGADQSGEVGRVRVERSDLRNWMPAGGDDGSFSCRRAAHDRSQLAAQLANAECSCKPFCFDLGVHVCTQADLHRSAQVVIIVLMNFAFTDEQEELRKTVRAFLEAKSSEEAVREQMETDDGYDKAVWTQMAEQMGLQGLHIPEEYGGSGFGYVELGIVLEEMGRSLLCAPFFSSVVLAANTLILSDDEAAKKAYLPGIASGETIATVAFTEPNGKWDESGIEATATASGDSYTISGTKSFVIDGSIANLIIVAAKTSAGTSLFAVEGDASGLTRTALSTMDQTRKQAKLEFSNTPATLIGTDGKGWDILSATLDLVAIGLAAEQVGGAQMVLDMAVEYAKVRVQFGRPIGSFQAIKHKFADMYVALELARSNAYYGAWALSSDAPDLPLAAATARVSASDAYYLVTKENIQAHGGMGFTWEFDCHLYYRRAQLLSGLIGSQPQWKEKLVTRLLQAA